LTNYFFYVIIISQTKSGLEQYNLDRGAFFISSCAVSYDKAARAQQKEKVPKHCLVSSSWVQG